MEESLLYMTEDATDRQLELAVMRNHLELFRMNAAALGGDIRVEGPLMYTHDGPERQAMVCLGDAGAARVPLAETREALDRMMEYYREHVPRGIGWWSLDPAWPEGVGALLLARGFQPGWRPYWMAMDLWQGELRSVDSEGKDAADPKGMREEAGAEDRYGRSGSWQIVADNEVDLQYIKGLQYAGNNGAVSRALMLRHPGMVQQFVAKLNGTIVGHSCVVLSTGQDGVAGIYNVAVVPKARERGIGRALVLEACRWASGKGWRYAVLNATGQRMYEQAGFRWIGSGWTWWLVRPGILGEDAPTAQEIMLAEAVGLGDIAALEKMNEGGGEDAPIYMQPILADWLDRPLANKLSLLEVAKECGQAQAAEWLLEHGARYTVLMAWELGWKDRAAALLAGEPSLVNMEYGPGRTTLLHIAAERNDMELARLALSAGPDLTVKDQFYKSTPLGWAKFFKREEITRMIEDATFSRAERQA